MISLTAAAYLGRDPLKKGIFIRIEAFLFIRSKGYIKKKMKEEQKTMRLPETITKKTMARPQTTCEVQLIGGYYEWRHHANCRMSKLATRCCYYSIYERMSELATMLHVFVSMCLTALDW